MTGSATHPVNTYYTYKITDRNGNPQFGNLLC